jgi:hypothetical protein
VKRKAFTSSASSLQTNGRLNLPLRNGGLCLARGDFPVGRSDRRPNCPHCRQQRETARDQGLPVIEQIEPRREMPWWGVDRGHGAPQPTIRRPGVNRRPKLTRDRRPKLTRLGRLVTGSFAERGAARLAGPVSKAPGRRRPDPRAGVKAREATRVSGLGLDAEHGSGTRRDGGDGPDENEGCRFQARFLKRQLSLPVSTMSQWWVRRSNKAVVIFGSPNTLGHSPKARFVVTRIEVRS